MSRVAIVTGGASGIGRATAELLTAQGVQVAVLDRNGGIRTDVSDPGSVAAAVAEARASLGPIDILVNAAGVAVGGQVTDAGYLDEWDRALAVNLTGTMLLVRACLDDLVAS